MVDPVVILGATSAMARALAEELAGQGQALVLAGRDQGETRRIAADLEIRYGVEARALSFDAEKDAADPTWFAQLLDLCGGEFEGLLLCFGAMFDESEARTDPRIAARMIQLNYVSAAAILERAADHLRTRQRGWICAITSVAGDRGRPSNYVYGSSKAALSTYLSGLRASLAPQGVRVVDVRPGFVDTSLTYGLPGLFLVAAPSRVARDILKAIKRDRAVVYTPFFWWAIMLIIRWLPDRIFKRLSL